MKTRDLVQALIARRSVTPDDAGCLDLITQAIQPLGFECERMDRNGVSNLWARRGSARPVLCFAGHTDVVPTGPIEQWLSDPFEPTLREGALYGRGASDMKSSLAAFVDALTAFLDKQPDHRGSIALLLTSDEEGPAVDGTVKVVEALAARGEALDYCIVGEPTSLERTGDMIKNGRRGSLSGELTVKGVRAMLPIPISRAIRFTMSRARSPSWPVWNGIAGTNTSPPRPGRSRTSTAALARTTSFPDPFRSSSTSVFRRRVRSNRSRRASMASSTGTASSTISTGVTRPAVYYGPRRPRRCGGARHQKSGRHRDRALDTGGTSDGRFIADICPQVVECGPTNRTIHKINECIAVDDLEVLPRIYEQILVEVLGDPQRAA